MARATVEKIGRTTNLYLACTPLQILNAVEARDRFHAEDNNYLVMFHSPRFWSPKRKHFFDLTDSMIDQHWTHSWNLKLNKISQLFFPRLAASMRRRMGHCTNIYTGGFQSQQNHLINTVPHDCLTLVDGGAGIIQAALNTYRSGAQKKSFHAYIPGMKPQFPALERARFFTSYRLDVDPSTVIENDYRMFRRNIAGKLPVKDEIVFLSQPLRRDLGVEVDADAVVQAAMSYHGVKKCRFILHPRETSGPAGCEKLPYLIELFGIREGYLPKAFVTYMSAAARSLYLIYGHPVTCFDIMPALPPDSSATTIRSLTNVYSDFAASGLPILPLPGRESGIDMRESAPDSHAA
jgi:hypothetical protein